MFDLLLEKVFFGGGLPANEQDFVSSSRSYPFELCFKASAILPFLQILSMASICHRLTDYTKMNRNEERCKRGLTEHFYVEVEIARCHV